MGARLAGGGCSFHRDIAGIDGQRRLYGQHARGVEYAGHEYRGHHDGLLRRIGRDGNRLSHCTESAFCLSGEAFAACRPCPAVLSELDLRPLTECGYPDCGKLCHRLPEGVHDVVVHPYREIHLQPEGCTQRVLLVFLSAGVRVRTAFDGAYGRTGIPLRLEVYVLFRNGTDAAERPDGNHLLPARQGQDGIADRRTASARNAGGGCRGADADVRGGLWEDARLDGLFQDSRLPGYRPHTDCLFHLVAGACRKALRQSGSLVSAQSHRGISLHDAGDVFQHVYHVAHQLYDFHLASGFRAYVPFIYMDAAGICAGGVHLLLVVQVATVAFPLPHSRRHGMLCPVFRHIVFYGFAGKHLRDAVFPRVYPRAGNAGCDYRVCLVLGRGPESEIPALECFFPDTEPFGAGADYGNFVLQQRALPPAAKVHAFVIGNPDDGRPAGGIAVLPIVEQRNRARTRLCRSGTDGDFFALCHAPAAKPAAGVEGHSGVAVHRDAGDSHRVALHSVP